MAGSFLQGEATKDAAQTAADAQTQAQATARADLAPWTEAGRNALAPVQDAAGLNGPDGNAAALAAFQQSPGYQFQFDQGIRALDASASASGMLRSGATQKAAMQFGQGLANQDFTTYYNRLLGMAQMGQNSAAGTAAGALATGQGLAQTAASAGTAQANAIGSATQGIGNAANTYANYSMYQNAIGQRPNALAPSNAGLWAGGPQSPPVSAGWG